MNQFIEGDCVQSSKVENETPLFILSKRPSNEYEVIIDGDFSTTILKAVKIEKDREYYYFVLYHIFLRFHLVLDWCNGF